jgi:asparagine N-glycosylation enzyme membrane subunit Stt3
LLTIAYGLLYRVMARRGADPLISSVMTLLAAICCIVHWLARPHLFSILLLVVWLALIESYRRRRSRMIWLVPPLMYSVGQPARSLCGHLCAAVYLFW